MYWSSFENGTYTWIKIRRSTYFINLGPIFFTYFCACDTSKASEKPFSIGVNRIDRGFRHDPAAARSDEKAKKILYRCKIGSLHSLVKTVMSGISLVGWWKISLKCVFLHSQKGPSGMGHVSIEVRTG
jgi:hypothetical protein